MRKCPKCSGGVQEESKVCGTCGTKSLSDVEVKTNAQKKRKNTIPMIGIVVVFIAIICVMTFGCGKEENTSKKNNDNSIVDNNHNYEDYTETEKPNKPANEIERTIMIYVVGSDLESRFGAATMDIEEMIKSEVDVEKNNVLVYTGGSKEWKNNVVSSSENMVLRVIDGDVETVKTTSAKNMGKSETLTDFLSFAKSSYPADQYCLILWDHGGGPLYGFGVDELANDYLTLDELEDALDNSPFGENNKLELLGFDACLMGSVETAWALQDYARYFVASQEVEPGYGWDYSFLKELQYCQDGAQIGKEIIDSYFAFYNDLFRQYPTENTDITLSCTDLSKINVVEDAIDALFSEVDKDVVAGQISAASRCRYSSKAFGKFSGGTEYDLVDLKHLASLFTSDTISSTGYSDKSKALEKALDNYVIYSKSNVKNANGVSIYHPYDEMRTISYAVDLLDEIEFASQYARYIKNFTETIQKSESNIYRDFAKVTGVAMAKGQQNDISIQLTKEQMNTFSGAEYLIFKELPADITFSKKIEYLHIFSGQDVSLSENGMLSATYEGKAVFGKDGKTQKYSDFPLSMYQIYDGSKEEKYYFPCMFQYLSDNIDEWKFTPVNWLMKIMNGNPQLLNAYDMMADESETSKFPDKFLINPSEYDIYGFTNNSYFVENNSKNEVVFNFSGSSYGYEYTKQDGFEIELRPVDYTDGYFAVFRITDIYGNTYNSQFIPLGK